LVGANLVELLTQRGWRVRALRRKSSSLKALEGLRYDDALGDVTEPDAIDAAVRGVDAVFHVAAIATYWKSNVKQLYHVNVEGTRIVLDAARRHNVRRVVFTSSSAACGRAPFGGSIDETHSYNLKPAEYHYGYTKVLAEDVAAGFVRGGLDVVTVNPGVIMGPRDVNLIGGSMITESAKRDIPVTPPGGVGMVDVGDVCEAHLAAFERGRTGERYLINGHNLWHRDILAHCKRAVGRSSGTHALPRALIKALAYPVDWVRTIGLTLPVNGEQLRLACETFWFDAGKAKRELGLTPRPFEETVERTARWYRDRGYL
jgi:dihydroflavonol-4-reductase